MINPPPNPGTEIGEGEPKLLWPQFLEFICSLQQFQGTPSQLGCQPTRPPELKQVAGKRNTVCGLNLFMELAMWSQELRESHMQIKQCTMRPLLCPPTLPIPTLCQFAVILYAMGK